MSPEGLSSVPVVTAAPCIKCHQLTNAPVAVRWIQDTSGPGTTLYACPAHAAELGAGPTPEDELHTP